MSDIRQGNTTTEPCVPEVAQQWKSISVPTEVSRIPSMLCPEEQQYLIWLTQEKFEGWGAIVEAGVWVGSSSACLAEGLRRKNKEATVHSLDLFRWEPYMTDLAGPIWPVGEDFLPLYRKETAAYAKWIAPRKLDLMNASWDGGPIEILFVDSAKTWDLTNAILRIFGPHLVPRRSRVVLQDFRYHYAHCLPLIFDSRPDVWEQVDDLGEATTVGFVPLKPLFGPSGIEANYSEESFPLEIAERLLRERMDREAPENRFRILQTLYRKYLIDGPMDQAVKMRQDLVAAGVDDINLKYMESVGDILNRRGWKAYEQGQYETARSVAERCLAIHGIEPVYPQTLLGFSLLRLGDAEGAKRAADDILATTPDCAAGKLLRAEWAISEHRYDEAVRHALDVIDTNPDEGTERWARNLQTYAGNLKDAEQAQMAVTQPAS